MACKYIYKGHEFKSELELDDFLIERLQYYSTLGDIVFDLEVSAVTLNDLKVTNELYNNEENKKLRLFLKRNVSSSSENENGSYELDGEFLENSHIIGVNKFWQYLELLNIFNEEEYFKSRETEWTNNKFNDNEKEILINVLKKTDLNTLDQNDFKQLRSEIKKKWNEIGKIGTSIHNALEIYFSDALVNYKNGISAEDMLDKLDNVAKEYFSLNIDKLKQSISNARLIIENIATQFGCSYSEMFDRLEFFPELIVTEELNKNLTYNGKTYNKLMGVIDLFVIDKKTGKKLIIDYKTSPRKYDEYASGKKVATMYQLYSYGHLLSNKGIDFTDLKYFVVPIHIANFKFDGDGEKWNYDSLNTSGSVLEEIFFPSGDEITSKISNDVSSSSFLPTRYDFEIQSDEALTRTMDTMKKMFPELSTNLTKSDEELKEWFYGDSNNPGLNLIKDAEGHYTFKLKSSDYVFVSKHQDEATAKGDIFLQLKNWYANIIKRNTENIQNVKKYLLNGMKNNEFNSEDLGDNFKAADKSWLNSILHEYEDNNWEIIEMKQAEALGILVLRNRTTNVFDFITIAGRNLNSNIFSFSKDALIKNRKYLTGHFNSQEFSDIYEDLILNSYMLQGTYGNTECVKTAVLLNSCTGMQGKKVGNIKVLNPYFHLIYNPTNKEILYSYERLRKAISDDSINLVSGKTATIKFLNLYEQCSYKFWNILTKVRKRPTEFKEEYRVFSKRLNAIDEDLLLNNIDGTVEERVEALRTLAEYLEKNHIRNLNTDILNPEERELFKNEFLTLYMQIQSAILELLGLTLRQQISDHEKYIPSLMVLRDGLASNFLDNAGNLKSETLNFVSKNVFATLLNSRDLIVPISEQLKKLVDELRYEKGLSVTENMLWGNQNRLYSEMTQYVNGEWLFKMPSLIYNPKAAKFLEYALETIAKHNKNYINKGGEIDYAKIKADKSNPYSDYYKVPLMQGGLEEVATSRGIIEALKEKLSFLVPSIAYERAQNYLEGLDNLRLRELQMKKKVSFFKMTNMFDLQSDPERRQEILRSKAKEINGKVDLSFFEHNIEKIVLQYSAASIIEKNMNNIFPLIKAAYYHLVQLGINVNTTFKNDIDYLTDYIKNKIFLQDINSEQFKPVSKVVNTAKGIASMMTLGFSPVQFTYLSLLGLWVVIKVFLTNLGNSKIKLKHYTKALKIAYSDILKGTDDITLPSELNKTYGLNDINIFRSSQVFSQAKHGLINFTRLLYKFATRPDYYNRLTLFLAQMDADGCLDAHHIEDGHLVYKCEEDERYAAFLKGNKNDPNYEKAKAAYYAAAVLFVNERALIFNKKTGKWEDFKIDMEHPMPLPRAYTSKEAESIKSLSDELYGYYDEEKKSLIHSVLVGGLWLQMKTFWSGKKNQYLAHGGIKLRGEWKHLTRTDESGKEIKLYYKLNQRGQITNEIVDENAENASDVAVILWTGTWLEGILLSLAHIMSVNPLLIKENFLAYYYNPNPQIRNAFRLNFYRFCYDMFMMVGAGGILARGFVNGFVNDLLKENKDNKDLSVGTALAMLLIANKTLGNSFLDFNFIESIGDPLWSWQPFTFSVFQRDLKNIVNMAFGDTNASDVIIKSFSATNLTSAFWRTLANQNN